MAVRTLPEPRRTGPKNLVQLGVATFVVNSLVGRHYARLLGPHNQRGECAYGRLPGTGPAGRPSAYRPCTNCGAGFFLRWPQRALGELPALQQRDHLGPSRFAAYLAFYPTSCHIRLVDDDGGKEDHGAADELTSIGRCREYVARLRNAGKDVALFEYAGAKHWFDNADLANRQTPTGALNYSNCTFQERDNRIVDAATGELAGANSPCVVSGGTYGYHPEASQQAAADLQNFLRRLFRLQ